MTVIDNTSPGTELEVRPDAPVAPARPAEVVRPLRAAPVHMVGTLVRRPVYVITTLRQSPRAREAAARAARPVYTTTAGCVSWAKRAGQAATHGAYRSAIQAAEAGGDREALALWVDKFERAKNDRSRRLRELPAAVFGVLRAAMVLGFVGMVLAVVLGLAIQLTPDGWTWGDWWALIGTIVTTVGNALYLGAVLAVWAALPVLAWAAYREGVRVADPPRWMRTSGDDSDIVLDEATIARALEALRIPVITQLPQSRAGCCSSSPRPGWTAAAHTR